MANIYVDSEFSTQTNFYRREMVEFLSQWGKVIKYRDYDRSPGLTVKGVSNRIVVAIILHDMPNPYWCFYLYEGEEFLNMDLSLEMVQDFLDGWAIVDMGEDNENA